MNVKLLRYIIAVTLVLSFLVGCSASETMPTSTPLPPTARATLAPLSPTDTLAPPLTSSSIPTVPMDALAPSPPPAPTDTLAPLPTSPPIPTPTAQARADGLTHEQAATLGSLEKVDDYPFYTMHYYGAYERAASRGGMAGQPASWPAWACSLFAALGDADNARYGRNFDWEYSPALLLFTHPPDGYASVSMVDMAYLLDQDQIRALGDLPLVERKPLLDAPYWPFDGMNAHGLVVGMAAVPGTDMPYDPGKATLDSLGIIREMLDHARDVDEAVVVMQSYNVDMGAGPPLHYLIADASGRAVLVEFYRGEMLMLPNERPWHLATNFLRAQADEEGHWDCARYDRIDRRLSESEGQITAQEAVDLLSQVAQSNTQWSVVYEMGSGDVNVVMGRGYDDVHAFHLDLADN